MKMIQQTVIAALLAALVAPASEAAELQPATVKAWNDYIRAADARLRDRLETRQAFLWTDESSDRAARVRRGETVVAPMVGRGTVEAPNGLIHDWIGATFIPNGSIDRLLAVVHDYDRYKDVYQPAVADSHLLACTPAAWEFSMVWRRRVLFVNAAMEGQYRAQDFAVDARRGYNIADAASMRQIEDYGRSGERFLPADRGSGYLWRLHSIARYEERDGGLYLELEVVALTRDIPSSLHWLVSPVVNHLSINSLTATLRQTREAVDHVPADAQRASLCKSRSRDIASAKPGPVE